MWSLDSVGCVHTRVSSDLLAFLILHSCLVFLPLHPSALHCSLFLPPSSPSPLPLPSPPLPALTPLPPPPADHGVFGVPLQVLVQLDRQRVDHVQIPLFIHESIQCLEEHGLGTEGILRVPGAAVRMKVWGGACGWAWFEVCVCVYQEWLYKYRCAVRVGQSARACVCNHWSGLSCVEIGWSGAGVACASLCLCLCLCHLRCASIWQHLGL